MEATIMHDNEFNQRLRELIVARRTEPTTDWAARRTWWINQIDKLFGSIHVWLEQATKERIATLSIESLTLDEERLGTYTVTRCTLRLGSDVVNITPVGTLVVGGTGRVDIEGPAGTAMLLLVPPVGTASRPEGQPVWMGSAWHLANAHTRTGLARLDKDVFQDVLLDLLGCGA
jgi:hypothetical protein